jgi:rhamnosyltransferase
MKKICPVISVVLYNPTDLTLERISLAVKSGFNVLVYDNSPSRIAEDVLAAHSESVRYFSSGDNVGIARALRALAFAAFDDGWQSMLYFDQDTAFTQETLGFISRFAEVSLSHREFIDHSNVFSVTFRANRTSRRRRHTIDFHGYGLEITEFSISSGTLFFLDKLLSVGAHDPSYFIDGVDYSICLAAEKHGQLVTELYGTPGLDHSTEQGDRTWSLLGKRFIARKYPAYRVRDYFRSSVKLIALSLSIGSRKTFLLIRLLLAYLALQLLVRFAHHVS